MDALGDLTREVAEAVWLHDELPAQHSGTQVDSPAVRCATGNGDLAATAGPDADHLSDALVPAHEDRSWIGAQPQHIGTLASEGQFGQRRPDRGSAAGEGGPCFEEADGCAHRLPSSFFMRLPLGWKKWPSLSTRRSPSARPSRPRRRPRAGGLSGGPPPAATMGKK